MRNKKEFILRAYIKNPHTDLKKLAEDNYIHYSHVRRTVNDFKESVVQHYPIYCEKSLDLSGVYYLFSAGEEKKIETEKGKIINKVSLTEYERYWLAVNKQIR